MNLSEIYTADYIENNGLVLLKVLVGSYSQNLQTDKSDKDYAGVFFLKKDDYFSLDYKNQNFDTVISNNPDITYFEIGKFIELLSKNNPNALEILASSYIEENLVYKHESFDININKILSKKCEFTFGKYASDQVKKATGLNKKINKPMSKTKKNIIKFCKFYNNNGVEMSLSSYLEKNNIDQKFIGLKPIKNAKSTYKVYIDRHSEMCFTGKEESDVIKKMYKFAKFKGIINPDKKEFSNQIRVSSIPKIDNSQYRIEELGFIYYNLEGYETYCKDYREYFEWVKKRNDERYKNNIGQQFDVKNMSHCCRLLTMAKEIATQGIVKVRRDDDADFFRNIKIGKVNYLDVISYSKEYAENLSSWYKKSLLKESPDYNYLNDTLIRIRNIVYYGR